MGQQFKASTLRTRCAPGSPRPRSRTTLSAAVRPGNTAPRTPGLRSQAGLSKGVGRYDAGQPRLRWETPPRCNTRPVASARPVPRQPYTARLPHRLELTDEFRRSRLVAMAGPLHLVLQQAHESLNLFTRIPSARFETAPGVGNLLRGPRGRNPRQLSTVRAANLDRIRGLVNGPHLFIRQHDVGHGKISLPLQFTARPATCSMPHILRIQRLRLVWVGGALDDRPAVGEDRELVIVHVELEQELVEADFPERCQFAGHRVEVELAGDAMADLHRVAAAQAGRLGTVFPLEPFELAAAAAGAVDLALQVSDFDAAVDVLPDVDVDQVAVNRVQPAGEDFECLGRLVA